MGNIVGPNGHPIGQAPPIARPNQVAVNMTVVKAQDGPGLVAAWTMPDGTQEQRLIPMTCDVARQLGVMLIGAAALFETERAQQQAAQPAASMDELLEEAKRNVGG
jgi:hypothetical protein